MVTQIGIVAGEIWNFLDEHGQVSLPEVTEGIKKPKELVLMSLGWLARENHILIIKNNGAYFIKLKKESQKTS